MAWSIAKSLDLDARVPSYGGHADDGCHHQELSVSSEPLTDYMKQRLAVRKPSRAPHLRLVVGEHSLKRRFYGDHVVLLECHLIRPPTLRNFASALSAPVSRLVLSAIDCIKGHGLGSYSLPNGMRSPSQGFAPSSASLSTSFRGSHFPGRDRRYLLMMQDLIITTMQKV